MVKISMPDIKKLKFFAINFKGTDKNIGKLDNFFSLSPIVMYLPNILQVTILKKLIIIASKIIRNLEYIGTMGIEFFLTKSKQLLVNEMAPRVHNSGHWTQSGCIISQFEQHIRAITGNSIGDGKRHSNIMMKNILGEDIYNIRYDSESSLNIYGKDEAKLNRKMGHSNIIK